jgi:hypothetical protein
MDRMPKLLTTSSEPVRHILQTRFFSELMQELGSAIIRSGKAGARAILGENLPKGMGRCCTEFTAARLGSRLGAKHFWLAGTKDPCPFCTNLMRSSAITFDWTFTYEGPSATFYFTPDGIFIQPR